MTLVNFEAKGISKGTLKIYSELNNRPNLSPIVLNENLWTGLQHFFIKINGYFSVMKYFGLIILMRYLVLITFTN